MARGPPGQGNRGRNNQNQNKQNYNNTQNNQNGQKRPYCNNCGLSHKGRCEAALCSTCKKTHRPPCKFDTQNANGKRDHNNNNNNNSNNDSNNRDQKSDKRRSCDYCSSAGHTSHDCRLHRAEKKRNKSSADVSMTGMDPRVLYCYLCNRNGHDEATCENLTAEEIHQVVQSKRVCWKCANRGHTADECRRTTNPGCPICKTLAHNIEECNLATKAHRDLLRQNQIRNGTPAQVFASNPATKRFMEQASKVEQARRAATGPTTNTMSQLARSPAPKRFLQNLPLTLATNAPRQQYPQSEALSLSALKLHTPDSFSEAKREAFRTNRALILREKRNQMDLDIAKRIDVAHRSYHKQWISDYFTGSDTRQTILENRLLSEQRLDEAAESVRSMQYHFFRDPKALEAIATQRKPLCRTCGTPGEICDRYLNPMRRDQDVLQVDDGIRWGVIIAMRCQCCVIHGYDLKDDVQSVFDTDGNLVSDNVPNLTPRTLAFAAKHVRI